MAIRLRLPKAPKKPKRNASIQVMENYIARRRDWEKRVNAALSNERKREALIRKVAGISNSIKKRK